MPIAGITDYAHVRITVTDITRSREFYDTVFGFPVAYEVPPGADADTQAQLSFLFGGVIYQFPGGLLGLRPVAPTGDRFDTDRVGLDHLSFQLGSLTELEAAAAVLDEAGIAHEGIKNLGAGGFALLEFRDPDGVALELTSPN